MPARIRYTREDIASAAFGLVRDQGPEALNARLLSQVLGCSTQPLFYQFESMEEIRREAYRLADEFHTRCITDGIDQAEDPLLALGLNYVRFAHEEPRLFRFLFQADGLGGQDMQALLDDPELGQVISVVSEAAGLCEGDARTVFLSLFIAAHGYASLLANNAIDFEESLVTMALTSAFIGAVAQVGEGEHEAARQAL